MREYYRRADVFILPSLSEGMPNVVLEAMASGLPIVMTPCEGSKELINGNGIIRKPADFCEALTKVCTSAEQRKRMGANSKILVQERFQWEQIAKRYLALIVKGTD